MGNVINITERRTVKISGLQYGPTWLYVENREELVAIIQALTEAVGLHVHEPDGCHDDGCPCYARGAGR